MLKINALTLREIAPKYREGGAAYHAQMTITNSLDPFLAAVMADYALNTPLRILHFLGQTCAETAGFRTLVEFASGERYEGRQDLGNVHPGDGVLYKGRGLIQLTGRANYEKMGRILNQNLVDNPGRVAEPRTALEVSCAYWASHGINGLADQDDIEAVTRAVNGGLNSLDDRTIYTEMARVVITRMAAEDAAKGAPTELDDRTFGPSALPVLRRGSKGRAVVLLQQSLTVAGYPLVADGDFGPATEAAVKAFQTARFESRPGHGVIDAAWWKVLTPNPPTPAT